MIRQIKVLCGLQMKNVFGFNEFRHSKDRKKQATYVAVSISMLAVLIYFIWFAVFLTRQLIDMGMMKLIPIFLYVMISVCVLFLNVMKAGNVLFDTVGYEILIPMPFSKSAIIISRFLNMFFGSLLLELVIMLPILTVYCKEADPGSRFFVVTAVGMLFLPLLPLTIASVAGALIKAASSRIPNKSLGETFLVLVLIVGILYGSMSVTEEIENISILELLNISKFLKNLICKMYPPAYWYENALQGEMAAMVMLIVFPIVIFSLFVVILQKYYQQICTAFFSVSAKKNYKMEKLRSNGILTALWKKELKRYFSSSIYVTQTVVGYVLAAVFSVMFLVMGKEKAAMFLEISAVSDMFDRIIPFVLATIFSITTTTAASISMEGLSLWQVQTLPVSEKQIYNSKILVNLIVAAPFYLISVAAMWLAMDGSFFDKLWIVVIPAVYIVFMSVLGIFVNLCLPILNSDNELRIVKQSASTMVTMVVGMLSGILPCVILVCIETLDKNLVMAVVVVILLAITSVLYMRCCKKKLNLIC